MTEREIWNVLKRKIIESEFKHFKSKARQVDWIIDNVQMCLGYTYNDIKAVYEIIPEIRYKEMIKLGEGSYEGLTEDHMKKILELLNKVREGLKERL